jgi:hypothetical protein
MGLRGKIRRLESVVRGTLAYFELRDGSRYYYDITEVYKEVFLHGLDCLEADSPEDWPEAPEVYRKMCEARDPAAVLERLTSADFVEFPYEMDALLNERCLVPLPHEPVEDLSEP